MISRMTQKLFNFSFSLVASFRSTTSSSCFYTFSSYTSSTGKMSKCSNYQQSLPQYFHFSPSSKLNLSSYLSMSNSFSLNTMCFSSFKNNQSNQWWIYSPTCSNPSLKEQSLFSFFLRLLYRYSNYSSHRLSS